MLADVDAGSNTPSMVSKVLAWKKRAPEEGWLFLVRFCRRVSRADWTRRAAEALWNALRESNLKLAEDFTSLATQENVEPHVVLAREHIEVRIDLVRKLFSPSLTRYFSPFPSTDHEEAYA